jgi:3-hydroxybutyryl-CoA dehydrogenase
MQRSCVRASKSLKLGANHPTGPLEPADFIGLDTCLAIMNVLHGGHDMPDMSAADQICRSRTAGAQIRQPIL